MDQTRESGGTRARAIPTLDARDLTIRLLLAERAIFRTGVHREN